MKQSLLRNTFVTIGSFIIVVTAVAAWTAPATTPPGGNVSAPVNVSASNQIKSGGLGVFSLIADTIVKVGNGSTVTCNTSLGGALRYNATLKCVEFCDETSWKCTNQAATQPPCTLPWGGTIASGASVTAYLASSVPFGSSCSSQTRTCTNGTLSGSYTYQSCSVTAPVAAVQYGGSFAKYNTGVCGTANVLTGGCSCPGGYVARQLNEGWDAWKNAYTCEATSGKAAVQYGGSFAKYNTGVCGTANLITGSCSCPSGYTAYSLNSGWDAWKNAYTCEATSGTAIIRYGGSFASYGTGVCGTANLITGSCSCPSGYTARSLNSGWNAWRNMYTCEAN